MIGREGREDLTRTLGHVLVINVRVARSGVKHICLFAKGKGGLINATFLMMIANEGAVAAKEHMIWKRWKKDNRKPKACIFTAA